MARSLNAERGLDQEQDGAKTRAGWSAVWALTLCVSTLIASEFMPLSILTPIPTELRISEGLRVRRSPCRGCSSC